MPVFDPVQAALRRLFGTQGNHEARIRNLERIVRASLIVTDGFTTIDPTGELLIGSGLSLADGGGGIAQLAALPDPPLVWTSGYCTTQTGASAGGGGFPRVNLVEIDGNGVTYGNSIFGNLGTTLTVTETGIYLVGFSIANLVNDDDTNPSDLSFGPDAGTWVAGEFPFGVNDRFLAAESWNVPGLSTGNAQGGSFMFPLTAGEEFSWGLGSNVLAVNITIDRGLFFMAKIG